MFSSVHVSRIVCSRSHILQSMRGTSAHSIDAIFHVILNARRLKVVMAETFPSFGTKAFVIRCVTTEDSNTPSLVVELVQMCRCQYFTTGFATESSMTSQSKTRNDVHLLL